jgi:hypothetical protein
VSVDNNTEFKSRDFNIVKFIKLIAMTVVVSIVLVLAYRSIPLSLYLIKANEELAAVELKLKKCKEVPLKLKVRAVD